MGFVSTFEPGFLKRDATRIKPRLALRLLSKGLFSRGAMDLPNLLTQQHHVVHESNT